jgi:hypothetical protein
MRGRCLGEGVAPGGPLGCRPGVGLGQQVDLPAAAVLQHGDVQLADKLACGHGFQLLVEADLEHLPDHDGTLIGGGA